MPEVGRVVVSQAGRQLEIDTSSQRLRRRFTADFEERIERMRRGDIPKPAPHPSSAPLSTGSVFSAGSNLARLV